MVLSQARIFFLIKEEWLNAFALDVLMTGKLAQYRIRRMTDVRLGMYSTLVFFLLYFYGKPFAVLLCLG